MTREQADEIRRRVVHVMLTSEKLQRGIQEVHEWLEFAFETTARESLKGLSVPIFSLLAMDESTSGAENVLEAAGDLRNALEAIDDLLSAATDADVVQS